MAETPAAATKCGECAAPLPWAALGRGILMFETAETRDLCATCTLNYYYRTGGLGAGSNSNTTSAAGQQTTSPFSFAAAAAAASAPPAAEKEAAKEPRCGACRRKTGLLGFACRCGGTFCAAHRHADAHGCAFDFVAFDRKRIAGENPRVAAPKVAKVFDGAGE